MESGFKRPVIIIQDDAFNDSSINTVIVVPLTTNINLADAPGNVSLSKKETHLSKDSVANISQIVTLDRERFLNKVSNLKHRSLMQIDEGIKLVLSLS
ncbi:type II toxin-antitoxin system PemK/MazF family toxin [Leptospira idonii]|uniref:Type II toxin-antitoxin system PemK/MazF family toxin n=1 Tax=Leptospira idonii TaxID=1193500 RepID=A0A4R9LWP6_9LEPT|nr:type II toxin-antitoxin system PemK/MazF family toxin [Leptospira idonii]TGN17387.1 type II toxin-antitoxin system PemK/MazF family toxin [Leptospira idonii]